MTHSYVRSSCVFDLAARVTVAAADASCMGACTSLISSLPVSTSPPRHNRASRRESEVEKFVRPARHHVERQSPRTTRFPLAGRVLSAAAPPGWSISDPVTFDVLHRTHVVILKRLPVRSITCVHAEPCPQRWVPHPVTHANFHPHGAAATRCGFVWQTASKQQVRPGEHHFVSRFKVASASRRVNFEALVGTWEEVAAATRSFHPDETRVVAPEALSLSTCRTAQHLRTQCASPVHALRRALEWVMHGIHCGNTPSALKAAGRGSGTALRNAREASGSDTRTDDEQARELAAICQAMGFGVRVIVGLNMAAARRDRAAGDRVLCDTYAWVEVLFPKAGWVEVDPGNAEDPMALPSTLVKCRGPWRGYSVLAPVSSQLTAARGRKQLVRVVDTISARECLRDSSD